MATLRGVRDCLLLLFGLLLVALGFIQSQYALTFFGSALVGAPLALAGLGEESTTTRSAEPPVRPVQQAAPTVIPHKHLLDSITTVDEEIVGYMCTVPLCLYETRKQEWT